MADPRSAVGVLYPGEMGLALIGRLRTVGLSVYTTGSGRGAKTAQRCDEAARLGASVVDSLRELVQRSEIVFSLVPPAAADDVVQQYCAHANFAPAGAVFVDANSIGPDLSKVLAARVSAAGCEYVDGAINGLAKNLGATATLFLSGPRADDVERLLAGCLRVRVLGDQVGQASAMKMLLSAFAKGVCALFMETALVAERTQMLETMCRTYVDIYPGLMEVVQRMLPTYPLHADRRATEMRELERTVRQAGIEPLVTQSIRCLHDLLADAGLNDQAGWTLQSVVEALAAKNFLSADPEDDAKMMNSRGTCRGL